MAKRILDSELIITRLDSGGIEFVVWIEGYRIRQIYHGYPMRVAKREFKALVRLLTNGRYK